MNSVNKVRFSLKGDLLASCDSDGVVKVWDVRMVKEKYILNILEISMMQDLMLLIVWLLINPDNLLELLVMMVILEFSMILPKK